MGNMRRMLVVGDPIIDRHWYCSPKGISPEAPILTWNVDKIVDQPGGTANVVSNIIKMIELSGEEIEVDFISVVPAALLRCLPEGFPTDGLVVSPSPATVKNRIIYETPHQQMVRFDQDNICMRTEEEENEIVKRIGSRKYDLGLISDYSHGGATNPVIKAVRASCEIVLCDPKGDDPYRYEGMVDIITPNQKELADMTDNFDWGKSENSIDFLSQALKGQREEDVTIVLKKGAKGCVIFGGEEDGKEFPPYRGGRTVIDPTGAGDTFISALAVGIIRGERLRTAIWEATRLAGIGVTYPNCWVPTEEACASEPFVLKS